MMTVPTTSWPVTTVRRSRKCFSMSRGVGFRRRRRERARSASGNSAASDLCDDPALLVFVALVLAAVAGTAVLARIADHHLGFPANLYRAERRVFCPRGRDADRRGDPLGHPVPRPAWLLDLISRGNVGAQPRQPDD